MRILHLIEPGSPGGGACTLRLLAEPLARLRSVEQDVIILGNRAHASLARRCGVRASGMLTPPVGQPLLARRALTSTIDLLERSRGRYDVVHAWTLPAAVLAAVSAPKHDRLATLTVGPVSGLQTGLLVRYLARCSMPLLASSPAVEDEYRSMGVAPAMLSVLPRAVNPASIEAADRATLRKAWEVDEEPFVVGLLSEPITWADARAAIGVIARVAATGRNVRLLLHHGAARRVEAERWATRLGYHGLMIVDDDVAEPWRVVNGLDAALLIGGDLNSMDLSGAGSPFALFTGGGRRMRPMPGIMPLLWAMSAGVPVIAEASSAVRDVIEDGRSGLLVDQHDINAASDRIMRIYDDPTIAGRLGIQARSTVRNDFHVSAFCVRLKDQYVALAGMAKDDADDRRDGRDATPASLRAVTIG